MSNFNPSSKERGVSLDRLDPPQPASVRTAIRSWMHEKVRTKKDRVLVAAMLGFDDPKIFEIVDQ